MSDLTIQASFNSGEWAPSLNARVDLAKYRAGAALLENFFVDYRGGASTRPGTEYILQAYKSDTAVRLIPFQATTDIGYVLEFGDGYIRFFIDGAPVLETAFNITGATKANPCVITVPANDFIIDDWIFIDGIVGMTELNGKYFQVLNVVGNAVTLGDLNGNPINSTGYTTYSSGGEAARVYTITSPYNSAALPLIKYAQNVSQMVLCHPDAQPYVLTLISFDNWTLLPITFGTTATAPVISGINTSLGAGTANYAYAVTSIDANGQESVASPSAWLLNREDIRTVSGTNNVVWAPAAGAVAYNIYRADISLFGPVPAGSVLGYIGTSTGVAFNDSNIAPDFSQTPPIARNPFEGAGIDHVVVTAPGVYTSVPTATASGVSTIAASLAVILSVLGTPTVAAGGAGYAIGDTVLFTNNVLLRVANVAAGAVTAWEPASNPGCNPGQVTAGVTPANPVAQVSTSGAGAGVTANLTWGVGQVQVLNSGAGFGAPPTILFSAGAATATAVLGSASNGYPTVPGFFQQRLALAAPAGAPQTLYLSQPGAYFNFNISSPVQADNAITATLVSGVLNTIKSMVPQTSGLLIFTDRASWLLNGGSPGSAITPTAASANPQSYVGTNDVPPIVANFDVLFPQAKGSAVRDNAYNIYVNSFTGTDITAMASHLFFGYTILEWAWAEEPFKLAWVVRNDGIMLNLTFLKEQEFVAWAHSITDGSFKSVACVTEEGISGKRDAVYCVVERSINGNTVKYIERVADRIFNGQRANAWCVDAALGYSGAPEDSFSGGEHLAGKTVTGLADGEIITPFVMPTSGNFTLASPASKVVIGLPFTCKLQTLQIDLGEPTIQGKVKKLANISVRVCDTLNIKVGPAFDSQLQLYKDTIVGNVSSMLTGQPRGSQVVTDLVTGDARGFPASAYTAQGQLCIQQDTPYPATILGVIPDITVGDTK